MKLSPLMKWWPWDTLCRKIGSDEEVVGVRAPIMLSYLSCKYDSIHTLSSTSLPLMPSPSFSIPRFFPYLLMFTDISFLAIVLRFSVQITPNHDRRWQQPLWDPRLCDFCGFQQHYNGRDGAHRVGPIQDIAPRCFSVSSVRRIDLGNGMQIAQRRWDGIFLYLFTLETFMVQKVSSPVGRNQSLLQRRY